jgi:hypothetical protein
MNEMLLFREAGENHEKSEKRGGGRNKDGFWISKIRATARPHLAASNNTLPVGYAGGVNGENK